MIFSLSVPLVKRSSWIPQVEEPVIEEAPAMPPEMPAEPAPVDDSNIKMQKKSSIFKSRFTSNQESSTNSSSLKKESQPTSKGRKGLALYRHKWHEDDANKGKRKSRQVF